MVNIQSKQMNKMHMNFTILQTSPQMKQSKSMEWKFMLGKQIQTLNNDKFLSKGLRLSQFWEKR